MRRDPLTKSPHKRSVLAEDRARLIKIKKASRHDGELMVHECDKCAAFFVHKKDFEKHEKSHQEQQLENQQNTTDAPSGGGGGKSRLPLVSPRNRKRSIAETRSSLRLCASSPRQNLRITSRANDIVLNKTAGAERSSERLSSRKRRSVPQAEEELPHKKAFTVSNRGVQIEEEDSVVVEVLSSRAAAETCLLIPDLDDGSADDPSPAPVNVANKKEDESSCTRRGKSRLRSLPLDGDDKGQIIYTCAHCLRNFRRKSNLKRHMLKLHYCGKQKSSGEKTSSSKWFTGYCCDICGEGLQVRAAMMAHRDILHSNHADMEWCKYQTSLARVKYCTRCKRYFRGGTLFNEHVCDGGIGLVQETCTLMKEAEERMPSFVCDICRLCFRWKWDYRAHREAEHRNSPTIPDWNCITPRQLEFVCGSCLKWNESAQRLEEHECAAKSEPPPDLVKPFKCDLCGNDYFWKSDFRRHMRTKHPKETHKPTEHDTIIYSCPYCEEKFSMKKRILQHMRKVHHTNSDSPFVCVRCNKVFRRRDNLDRHNESYHPSVKDDEAENILKGAEIHINGDLVYHCHVCNRNICNPNRFISHYRGHHCENKFTCDSCGKQTKTQHQLNTHIKNIHLNIRNYKCDLCDKSFYTKQACEEHRRIHTGERPFSCEICGKTFVAGNALISHKRFHNDFYPHSCHLCPKKFKVRRSLINHIRTHTGERPFQCNVCHKTFNNSSQYSYHTKVTHSDARPFLCPICGNGFKANKFLARHMELHKTQRAGRRKLNTAADPGSQFQFEQQGEGVAAAAVTATATTDALPIVQPEPQHTVISLIPNFDVKEITTTYRDEDVAITLYNVQSDGNAFGQQPQACSDNIVVIDASSAMKRPYSTAAEAYTAAANYALAPPEDTRPYVSQPSTGHPHPAVGGKHLTWLGVAPVTRKRSRLLQSTNSKLCTVDEERAKMVKSKKMRPPPSASSSRSTRTKPNIFGVTDPPYRLIAPKPANILFKPLGTLTPVTLLPVADASSSTVSREKSYTCDLCSLKLPRKSDLRRHLISAHRSVMENVLRDLYTCHHCGHQCKRKFDMQRHIVKIHLTANSSFTCAVCNRGFQFKTSLRRHVTLCHLPLSNKQEKEEKKKRKRRAMRGYSCDICGQAFQKVTQMMAHRDVLHGTEKGGDITWSNFRRTPGRVKACLRCGKSFRDGKFHREHSCDVDRGGVLLEVEKATNDDIRVAERLKAAPTYRCDQCSLGFHWKLVYRQHRQDAHPRAPTLDWSVVAEMYISSYCKSCLLVFDNEQEADQHKCDHDHDHVVALRPEVYPCSRCSSTYSRKADCRRHMREKHPQELQNDPDLIELGKSRTGLECPFCSKVECTKTSMVSHINEAHNVETDTPFMCVPCNKLFRRKITMLTHNQVYHPTEEKEEETERVLKEAHILLNGDPAWHCSMCNRNFLVKERFLAHHRMHNIERKFTCDLCGKQMRTQHQLNSHIKFIHMDIRKHECDLCGKGFHSKQACKEHRRIHTGERPFSCEVCGKTFIAMNALITHQKFHNDFFGHPCHLCSKKFKVRRSLLNHIRTHTGERPFKCDLCPKTFNNSSRFSYHKKVTHSNDRPFTCDICGSCFKANKFLMRHKKLHQIRTHIQFRRRNNPAYFEATDQAGSTSNKRSRTSQKPDHVDIRQQYSEDEFDKEGNLAVFNIQGSIE